MAIDFDQIGNVLGGVGASLQGRGLEFAQQQNQQRRQAESDEFTRQDRASAAKQKADDATKNRQITQFTDGQAIATLIERNDIGGVVTLLTNRMEGAKNFPDVDFTQTQQELQIAQMCQSGDGAACERLEETFKSKVSLGSALKILEGPKAVKASDVSDEGQTFSRSNGVVTATDVEGFKVSDKSSTLTSLEKNLKAAGLVPGTPEYKEAVLEFINKPQVQIGTGGDKSFQSALAKAQAKRVNTINESRDSAIEANQSLTVLEGLDVKTGSLEPFKQALASFGAGFGIDTSRLANIEKGEAFNAEAQRIVLSVKASQKGPQTDKDETTIRQTVARMSGSDGGNQFIMDSARALNNRRIEQAEFYDNFIEQNDGNFRDKNKKTADSAWAEFKRNTPMLSTNLRTPEGLPVFFYKFEQEVREANPDATKAEILEFWRQQNKRKK